MTDSKGTPKHVYTPGQRFGRWTILAPAPPYRHNDVWHCRCDCGTEKAVRGTHLRSGMSPSCGCQSRENPPHLMHGGTGSTEYRSWLCMRNRCNNPKNNRYYRYGARGIRVCPEWETDFAAFLAHIGPKPSPKHSVDRKDNDGHYEPGNVRWATALEQWHNRRPRLEP